MHRLEQKLEARQRPDWQKRRTEVVIMVRRRTPCSTMFGRLRLRARLVEWARSLVSRRPALSNGLAGVTQCWDRARRAQDRKRENDA